MNKVKHPFSSSLFHQPVQPKFWITMYIIERWRVGWDREKHPVALLPVSLSTSILHPASCLSVLCVQITPRDETYIHTHTHTHKPPHSSPGIERRKIYTTHTPYSEIQKLGTTAKLLIYSLSFRFDENLYFLVSIIFSAPCTSKKY